MDALDAFNPDDVVDPFPGLMNDEGDGVIIPLRPTLETLASAVGDVSGWIEPAELGQLGQRVVEDYQRDLADRRDWEDTVKEALDAASQESKGEPKSYPWPGCSNIKFPLLTTAALQFNARAYPAIVKGDEAINVKVVGKDRGRPKLDEQGQPLVQGPDGRLIPVELAQTAPPQVQEMLQPAWEVPPGGKAERAQRVTDYLNTVMFYRMDDWEGDTDALLLQLPIVGCVFRKVWWDADRGKQCAQMVPALRVVVPAGARSVDTTPRLTEVVENVYPYEINAKMRSGFYRAVDLPVDDAKPERMLLEQHRLIDMDEDGLEEPYIVTVDLDTSQVLRIEPNYGPEHVKTGEDGRLLRIDRYSFFVKYDFFPHPQGKFYGIGLGHLLKQLGAVVNTAINQLLDAGTAQTAGGGFIASGIRLQGRHSRSAITFAPGEWKTVDGVNGMELRAGIVDRTLPQVSPVTFNVLDMILGAARDISGVKDVITGDASNMGQVGTTLAMIEQGLQVFNAVYKRVYRSLKTEFTLIYENVGKYGGQEAAQDYAQVMDDPAADFEADFNGQDFDIRPVSDPSSVTRMQKGARAQALLATANIPGANVPAILKRVYEALDAENPDELIIQPQGPDPVAVAAAEARAAKDHSVAQLNVAKAGNIALDTELDTAKAQYDAFKQGLDLVA